MADLIRARHAELGVVQDVPNTDHYLKNGWEPVPEGTLTSAEEKSAEEGRAFQAALVESGTVFDPAAHKTEEVVAHLADADEGERERVLAAERSGKARKTVLEATDSEG